jgi:hypothetical protein
MTYFPDSLRVAPVDDRLIDLHVACQFDCDAYPLVDSSLNGVTAISALGASLDTGVKKYGSGSLQLTSGYVRFDAIQWGFEPWTVDGWFRWDAHAPLNDRTWLMSGFIGANTSCGPDIWLEYSPSGILGCAMGTEDSYANTVTASSQWTVGDTAFHHVALQRRNISGVAWMELYLDGILKLSLGVSTRYSTYSSQPTNFGFGPTGNHANIHVDSLRVTTGVCRYAGNFSGSLPGALVACALPSNPLTGEIRQTSLGDMYECTDAGTNTWRKLTTL